MKASEARQITNCVNDEDKAAVISEVLRKIIYAAKNGQSVVIEKLDSNQQLILREFGYTVKTPDFTHFGQYDTDEYEISW